MLVAALVFLTGCSASSYLPWPLSQPCDAEVVWQESLEGVPWKEGFPEAWISPLLQQDVAPGAISYWSLEKVHDELSGGGTTEAVLQLEVPLEGEAGPAVQEIGRINALGGIGWRSRPAFSSDGSALAILGSFRRHHLEEELRISSREAGEWTHKTVELDNPLSRPAWSPDSRELAVLEVVTPENARNWKSAWWRLTRCDRGGTVLRSSDLGAYTHSPGAVSWSPDGTRLLVVLNEHLYVLDATTLEPSHPPIPGVSGGHSGTTYAPQWNHDGSLASLSAWGRGYLYDPASHELRLLHESKKFGQIVWVGETNVLLALIEQPGATMVFAPPERRFLPVLIDADSGEVCELVRLERSFHVRAGRPEDGMPASIRRSFAAWWQ